MIDVVKYTRWNVRVCMPPSNIFFYNESVRVDNIILGAALSCLTYVPTSVLGENDVIVKLTFFHLLVKEK